MESFVVNAVGTHREHLPEPALRDHFARLWLHEVPHDVDAIRIVPDGCVDLVWSNGRLSIAGPDRVARSERGLAGTLAIGLRFHPGAAEHWLFGSSDLFVDRRVPLEDVWGRDARELAEVLAHAERPEQVAALLQASLVRRAAARVVPDPWAREVLQRLRGQVASRRATTTLRDLGVGERTLLRRTRAAFGYGPKFLHRVLRFQRFLDALQQSRPPPLSSLAFDVGYADQAHLTRETVELSGFTPAALARQFASGAA